tara:strand:+ start:826 stop:2268 length:1443 start_codon:yes stop_codon:yes gene_type:complete
MPVRDIYDLPPVPVEGQSPMEFFGVDQMVPRLGAYDPEADLVNTYGTLPRLPGNIESTPFGLNAPAGREMTGTQPGWAVASQYPGTPVIAPQESLRRQSYENVDPTSFQRIPGTALTEERVPSMMEPGMAVGGLAGGGGSAGLGAGIRVAGQQGAARVGGPASRAAQNLFDARAGRDVSGPSLRPPKKPFPEPGQLFDDYGYRMVPDEVYLQRARDAGWPLEGRALLKNERGMFANTGIRQMTPEQLAAQRSGTLPYTEAVTYSEPWSTKYIPTSYKQAPGVRDARFQERVIQEAPFNPKPRGRVPEAYEMTIQRAGGHTDEAMERLAARNQALQAEMARNQALIGTGKQLGGPLLPFSGLAGTVGGGVAGLAYDEVFGESGTTYQDPSGKEREGQRARIFAEMTPEQRKGLGASLHGQVLQGYGLPADTPTESTAKMLELQGKHAANAIRSLSAEEFLKEGARRVRNFETTGEFYPGGE